MFGDGKKAPAREQQDTRDDLYTREWEYRTLSIIGAGNLDKALNENAANGWELVNGSIAGTVHVAYLRRRLKAGG